MLGSKGSVTAVAAQGVVTRDVGGELVAYDPATTQTHALNALAAQVLGMCDGSTTAAEIADRLDVAPSQVSVEVVELAIGELSDAGLVVTDGALPPRYSRRRAIQRVAALGAGAVAVPVITSIVAPSVAAAQSNGGGGGGGGGGGDPVLEFAAVTFSGTMEYDTFLPPTSFSTAQVDLNLTVDAVLTAQVLSLVTSASDSGLVSGTISEMYTGPFDLAQQSPVGGPMTITWNDASISTGTLQIVVGSYNTPSGGTLFLTISSGRFSALSSDPFPQGSGVSYPAGIGCTVSGSVPPPDPWPLNLSSDGPMGLGG